MFGTSSPIGRLPLRYIARHALFFSLKEDTKENVALPFSRYLSLRVHWFSWVFAQTIGVNKSPATEPKYQTAAVNFLMARWYLKPFRLKPAVFVLSLVNLPTCAQAPAGTYCFSSTISALCRRRSPRPRTSTTSFRATPSGWKWLRS
jgi:hypothetical protein